METRFGVMAQRFDFYVCKWFGLEFYVCKWCCASIWFDIFCNQCLVPPIFVCLYFECLLCLVPRMFLGMLNTRQWTRTSQVTFCFGWIGRKPHTISFQWSPNAIHYSLGLNIKWANMKSLLCFVLNYINISSLLKKISLVAYSVVMFILCTLDKWCFVCLFELLFAEFHA